MRGASSSLLGIVRHPHHIRMLYTFVMRSLRLSNELAASAESARDWDRYRTNVGISRDSPCATQCALIVTAAVAGICVGGVVGEVRKPCFEERVSFYNSTSLSLDETSADSEVSAGRYESTESCSRDIRLNIPAGFHAPCLRTLRRRKINGSAPDRRPAELFLREERSGPVHGTDVFDLSPRNRNEKHRRSHTRSIVNSSWGR